MLWAGNQFGLIPSLFFDEGKNWGRSRRIISPLLARHNVASMLPVVVKVHTLPLMYWYRIKVL